MFLCKICVQLPSTIANPSGGERHCDFWTLLNWCYDRQPLLPLKIQMDVQINPVDFFTFSSGFMARNASHIPVGPSANAVLSERLYMQHASPNLSPSSLAEVLL